MSETITKIEDLTRGKYVYLDAEVINTLEKEALKDETGKVEESPSQEIKRLLKNMQSNRKTIAKGKRIECQ